MAALTRRIAARLAGIAPYRPGRPSPAGEDGKLSANEAPLGPAPAARAAAVAAARSLHRYPERHALEERLAAHLGVPPSCLVVGNGSDELCYLLAFLALGPATTAVVGNPCYRIDETASLLSGAEVRRVPLRADGGHDLVAMARAARDAQVVWLPNPHNPTGVAADPAEVASFLAAVPADCLVVLDEAYRAFVDDGLRVDVTPLLARHANLVVQRTLSKDMGLAGLRVGYLIAHPTLAEALNRVRPPFNVNAVAVAAGTAALANPAWAAMTVRLVRRERARLQDRLDQLGVPHFRSQANFVTARLDGPALHAALDAAGISVRSGDDLGLPGWSRISVGWPPQMAVLRHILATHLTPTASLPS